MQSIGSIETYANVTRKAQKSLTERIKCNNIKKKKKKKDQL